MNRNTLTLVTVSIPLTVTVAVDADDADAAMDLAEEYMRATRADLVAALKRHGADDVVVGTIEALDAEEDA